MNRINLIRAAERESHTQAYSEYALFQQGSWLAKPVKTVMDILPLFDRHQSVEVLDLGCGVGRNAIPIAMKFADIPCKVTCIDLLPLAIEKLTKNAETYGVDNAIEGIIAPIEDYKIKENSFDLILAVSALEHLDSVAAFDQKLSQIKQGIRPGGVVCLILNSQVREVNAATGEKMEPQFEVNLSTEEMMEMLESHFGEWDPVKRKVDVQNYEIPRGEIRSKITTNVVTLAARKAQ